MTMNQLSDSKSCENESATNDLQVGGVEILATENGQIVAQTKRVLTPRRAQFLLLGGLIGTAIWTGIGYQLNTSGSLGLWLGMMLWGALVIIPTTEALAELGTYLPVQGTIYVFVSHYIDPAASFALGWLVWYGSVVFIAVEYTAVAILFRYWSDVNPGAWIAGCIALSSLSNSFGVAVFGEIEFVVVSFKLVTIIGLIIATFVLMLGGNPQRDRFGFRNFREPVIVKEYVAEGNLGRFLAIWSAVIYGAFAIGGPDIMSTMLGEIQNPRRNYPKVAKLVYVRLGLFYGLGILCIGILCGSEDPRLLAGIANDGGANISPWIVGMRNLGIPVLPHLLNAVFITSAWSCANMSIFSSSRVLYALALQSNAPAMFRHCTPGGLPYICVIASSVCSCLAFMVCSNNAVVVFQWLASLFACSTMICFCLINICFLRFRAGLKAQGRTLESLPYVGKLQPYASYVGLTMLFICLLTNGWTAFLGGQLQVQTFVTGYLGIPVFGLLFISYKVVKKTKLRKASEMDLDTGVNYDYSS